MGFGTLGAEQSPYSPGVVTTWPFDVVVEHPGGGVTSYTTGSGWLVEPWAIAEGDTVTVTARTPGARVWVGDWVITAEPFALAGRAPDVAIPDPAPNVVASASVEDTGPFFAGGFTTDGLKRYVIAAYRIDDARFRVIAFRQFWNPYLRDWVRDEIAEAANDVVIGPEGTLAYSETSTSAQLTLRADVPSVGNIDITVRAPRPGRTASQYAIIGANEGYALYGERAHPLYYDSLSGTVSGKTVGFAHTGLWGERISGDVTFAFPIVELPPP